MIQPTPSFQEDHDSQIPALQLLQNLGYTYLTPEEAFQARGNKLSNILLESILENQLKKINTITFKGQERPFSDASIRNAIRLLKDIHFEGLTRTNELIFDLLSLGESFKEEIEGDVKSPQLRYIDWENPSNNVFHVTEEFEVEKASSHETRRPDIVLFVNGIPFAVIECKRRDLEDSIEQAISQQIRNQKSDEIPRLFIYSQLLLALSVNGAKYATVGTPAKFWSFWREREKINANLSKLINTPLSTDQKEKLFSSRFKYVKNLIESLENGEIRLATEQDQAIYSLCRPDRLLDLTYKFIVFDKPNKKIARYQQYFAVKNTITRIKNLNQDGKRQGGVIWHTQGSGKSLTMVMIAKSIALEPTIKNPKIIIVTDRKDLDKQISDTFKSCGKTTVRATTGIHLIELLKSPKEIIITTVINKFEAVLKKAGLKNESSEIFVLVDESHRTQYGQFNINMQRIFPNGCYIGFTGTPLLKKEKNTVEKFGGFIDKYTIDQAVADKAVVPLLYEGRLVVQEVNQKQIDTWFERVSSPLTEDQKRDLKRKFATANQINVAEQRIKQIAYDISVHFQANWKGTGFKAQLTIPDKASALKYKKFLDEFALVTSEVIMSPPDTREGHEDVFEEEADEVQKFWKKTMELYGDEDKYNEKIIDKFDSEDSPEILIVIDKLLTGFDCPRNTVLYVARSLREHNLLQAIARVNRLCDGKDYGYIIDYYGILGDLDKALTNYNALADFDEEDIGENTLISINKEVETLPQKHSTLWDCFKTIKNKSDIEAFEQYLGDEAIREEFYTRLTAYKKTLGVAMSSLKFVIETAPKEVQKYKVDKDFFDNLRNSVRQRYAETISYKDYKSKILKIMDSYVDAYDVISLTDQINIFDRDKFDHEISKLKRDASKADTIAHRIKRTIHEHMDEDPIFYKKFSIMLEEIIQSWQEKRITDAEYLKRVKEKLENIRTRSGDAIPDVLNGRDIAKAFFGVIQEMLNRHISDSILLSDLSANMALSIDDIIQKNKKVDWIYDQNVINKISNEIDDILFEINNSQKTNLTPEEMDSIIQRSIEIAKKRYI